ncbi:RNA polymerase sigma factor [Clostridium sp. D46t1_190503_E9]|uniref:RNA polymerase sigma factor n=1 Tax=Clostridium sp. D46t1_190503_E9 TaxID=2787137 RepID=UPI001FAB57E0|nr:RNA polymerase sigma factor [Clostridium sp. D46t1_190503_E9]
MKTLSYFDKRLNNLEHIKLMDNKCEENDFISLVEPNATAYYRIAKGILSSEEDVKDAIQNTLIIIYNKLYTLKNISLFKTWSIRILISECNKIYNLNRKVVNLERIEDISSYTINSDNKIDLYNAISTLSKELRIPTILFYFDDLSYKEISKILSIPEGTVKSRVFRAKEKLYEILKED